MAPSRRPPRGPRPACCLLLAAQLSGTLPAEHLSALVRLEVLDLSDNTLTGTLPVARLAAALPALMLLDLSLNRLEGEGVLALGANTELHMLRLSHNLLRGRLAAVPPGVNRTFTEIMVACACCCSGGGCGGSQVARGVREGQAH